MSCRFAALAPLVGRLSGWLGWPWPRLSFWLDWHCRWQRLAVACYGSQWLALAGIGLGVAADIVPVPVPDLVPVPVPAPFPAAALASGGRLLRADLNSNLLISTTAQQTLLVVSMSTRCFIARTFCFVESGPRRQEQRSNLTCCVSGTEAVAARFIFQRRS